MTCPCEQRANSIIFEGKGAFYAYVLRNGVIVVKRWYHPQAQDECVFCKLKQTWQFNLNIKAIGYQLVAADNITDAYNKVIPIFNKSMEKVGDELKEDVQRSTGVEPRWADIDLS